MVCIFFCSISLSLIAQAEFQFAKLKTSLQLIALGILILSESGITIVPIILFGKIALWLAAILTLYTGYDYLKSGFKHL